MFSVVHSLILIIVSLFLVFSAPLSSVSAVLTFTFLRSCVHPYFNSTSNPHARNASTLLETAVLPAIQESTLPWAEVCLLTLCTLLTLSLAYLIRCHFVTVLHLVRCSGPFLTATRFVSHLMGYDPAKPSTWSISQLRLYATEHHIPIPSGCEKSELVALVRECMTKALLVEVLRKENAVDEAVLPDILGATAETILRHKAYPSYAKTLRQHPQKLQAIIEAGLHQLESLSSVARFCGAQLRSPLAAWLEQVARAEDSGASLAAVLTPAEGAAAAPAVCGRFCGDGDMVVRCLDCGADPTCVMCMDCFRHSPCVSHRYRITQSSGSGMCDCGDPTAWKPESFCSRHRPAAVSQTSKEGGVNPLDTLAEEDREWVVTLLRGMVQYIALSILQSLRIDEALKRAKALEKGSKKPDKSSSSSPAAKDSEAALMEDVALIADFHDWLTSWLVPVAEQLLALVSTKELAKQIVAQLWTEPLHLSAAHASSSAAAATATAQQDAILAALPDNFSCLHPIFLHETLRPVTDNERPLSQATPDSWRATVINCIGHCLSVARLRLPVGALMATYAECLNAHDSSVNTHSPLYKLQVQVLTNPDVLKYLMTPAHMPYRNATNTVVHRVLSSIFYTLCVNSDQGPRNAILSTASEATDGLIFIEHQSHDMSFGSVVVMNYCLSSLPAVCYTLVVNRLAWRALAQIYGTLAISGYIFADPDAPADATHFPTPDFFARYLSRHTWLWLHAIRTVLVALMRLPADDHSNSGASANDSSAAMPVISPAAITAALQLPEEMWQCWTGATHFDAPPDVSRRRRVFMQTLDSCQVENGSDDALLILQKSPLAVAQRAAIQQHVEEEAEGEKERPSHAGGDGAAASAPATMHPSLATAVGYAVQMLYEISRTMDAVFQKQRDGFCGRCHTIALERESHPGAEAVLASTFTDTESASNEEAPATQTGTAGAPSPASPQSQCSVNVFDYNLLPPSLHATTFSNHLPRMFGTVLLAWVIEQRTSRPSAAASGAAATTTRLSGLYDDGLNAAAATSSSAVHLARPLRTLLDCFFKFRAKTMPHLVQDRLTFCQQLLDALVMPQVLMGQVFDGLWRRDSYSVSAASAMYIGFSRSVSAEFDILMMQVLTMELAPADMAIHILRRFSYAKQSLRAEKRVEAGLTSSHSPHRQHYHHHNRAFRKYLKGYKYYLRLMLTLVVDTMKASFDPPLSLPCIERAVARFLAQKKALHSTIVQAVSDSVRSGDYGATEEAEADEKDLKGNSIRFTQMIDAAIKKLAVAQDSNRGKQFGLRDAQTWKAYVSLYQISIADVHLEEIHDTYRSIALASRATALKQPAAEEEEDSATSAKDRYALPPTQLSDTAMYAELLPTTRALLHTDALLLPALYVLHEYTNTHAPPPPPTQSSSSFPARTAGSESGAAGSPLTHAEEVVLQLGREDVAFVSNDLQSPTSVGAVNDSDNDTDTDTDDNSNDDEDANLITREALLHAVTALYLSVQDCRSITRAMQAVEFGVGAEDAAAEASAMGASGRGGGSGNDDSISWDLVELYLHRYRVNELSFTPASCAAVLPLPELICHPTLLHKLQTPVTLYCSTTAATKASTVRVSSADMLHRLRNYLHSNKDADVYSCLEMVEEILVLTGLATFDTAAATAEQNAKEEAARSRKKQIQERQAKLMQRMRIRMLKTAIDKDGSPVSTTAAATASAGEKAAPSPSSPGPMCAKANAAASTSGVTGSLLTKLLLELATLDCCVCHATTEEPLFLLCHISTSSVLPQLGALTLPDERGVHNHLSVCGHAAHKTCVEKLFVRLSVLWQRWNFRSQHYLGPTEFNCPLCSMIVTALAPVPSLPLGVSSPVSLATTSACASLFEELQTGTMHPSGSHNDRTEDVVVRFQTNLANSAVGFSPSEDIPAIVAAEDELQKGNEAAWTLSETIRTFFYAGHLLLEGVKAGLPISHRQLISLLSLLVSITPAKLQAVQTALRANYQRTTRDQDSLLLLEALLKPREATQLIHAHVIAHLLPEMPQDYLLRLFACVEHARPADHSADGKEKEGDDDDDDEKKFAGRTEIADKADGSGVVSAYANAAAALEADFPGTTVAVWKAVGVLTLLKALLVEDASDAIILTPDSFTVAGTVTFRTLSTQSIATPAARCTAILRMLQYLLPVSHKSSTEHLCVVVQDLLQCIRAEGNSGSGSGSGGRGTGAVMTTTAASLLSSPPELLYTDAAAYVDQIAERVLHLPRVYTTLLTSFAEHRLCSVCHKEATNPVLCCRCGQHLCMHRQRSGPKPEMYEHVRTCGGGGAVGMFLVVRQGSFYVMELTCGRLYVVPGNYTDEYGERDRNLHRGVPLYRDREETQKLIELWMQNAWGATSVVFSNSTRMDLTEL